VLLNLLLIPRFGITGAASATLCSELTVLSVIVWLHFGMVGQVYHVLIMKVCACAGLATVVAVLCFDLVIGLWNNAGVGLVLALVAAGVVYLIALSAVRCLQAKDLNLLREFISPSQGD
jgi:O-antigen/teichoic acid export membrane protein